MSIIYIHSVAYADITQAFAYQGKLINSNGTNITNSDASCINESGIDTCDFRVSLYTSEAGGTLVWQETKSDIELYDNDGIFNLTLDCSGSFESCNQNGGPDFTSGELYIQVEFDPSGNGDFAENESFSPRRILTAVPYSFNSLNSDQLGGYSATSYLRSDANDSVSEGYTLSIDGSLDINGDIIISDENLDFDGTYTNFDFTGDFSINTDNIFIEKTTGYVGIGTTNVTAFMTLAGATSGAASLNILTGAQPSSGNAGDIYSDGTNLYFYDGILDGWVDLTALGSGASTLQEAYLGGNEINVTGGEGTLSVKLESANFDIRVGQGADTGDFLIWDGTDAWIFIDEGADTLQIGAAASGGLIFDAGTGSINLGNSDNAKSINIGTGNLADTINIATNSTTGDTINIGNSNPSSTLTLTGGDNWSISASGAAIFSGADIGGLNTTGTTVLGDNSNTVAINSSSWDITADGAVTGITFDANGTGNSVSNIEGTDLMNNTLNFSQFADGLSLDNATSISLGTHQFTINLDGTGEFIIQDGGNPFFTFGNNGSTTVNSGGFSVTNGGVTITNGALAVNSDLITSDGILVINATNAVQIGDTTAGNYFEFSESNGPTYYGTARPTRKITLSPEYPGAVLTGDGTNNNGTMTSDFCSNSVSNVPDRNTSVCNTSGDIHNYYQWAGQSGSIRDYDIWIRWRVPDNFAGWVTDPVKVYGKRTDTTNNAVNVYIYDTAGNLDNTGGTQIAGTNWTQNSVAASLSGTYNQGEFITIRIEMITDTGGDLVQVGEITIDYYSNN